MQKTKIRRINKKTIFITGTCAVLVIVFGLGIHFGYKEGIFTQSKQNTKEENNNLSFLENSIDFDKSVTSYVEKNSQSIRNGYQFKCDYTFDNERNVILEVKENYESDIVCLFLKDNKKTNNFPIIIFDNLLNELSPLNIEAYEKNNNNEIIVKASEITDAKNAIREEEARKNAQKVSSQLLDSIAFGPEIVAIDEIIFQARNNYDGLYNSELGEFITSNNNYITHGKDFNNLTAITNRKIIKVSVPSYYYDIIENEENQLVFSTSKSNNANENVEELKDISFDVYEAFYIVARQYGMYLIEMSDIDNKDFLNLLTSYLDEDNKYQDFVIFYNYFNNLNLIEDRNYNRRYEEDGSLSNYAKTKILDKFRNDYYPFNIMILSYDISDYETNSNWQLRTYRKFKYGLLHYSYNESEAVQKIKQRQSALPKSLHDNLEVTINEYESNGSITQNSYNKVFNEILEQGYLVYKVDNRQAFEIAGGIDRGYRYRYYLLSKTNLPDQTNSKAPLVGNIFSTQETKNSLTYQDSDYLKIGSGCQSLGSSFETNSIVPIESKMLRKVISNNYVAQSINAYENMNYTNLSKGIDKQWLTFLEGIFNYKELAASLFALYAYSYPDKRNVVGQCSFEYSFSKKEGDNGSIIREYYIKEGKYKRLIKYADYQKFKTFGINIYGNEREKKAFSKLFHFKVLNSHLYYDDVFKYSFYQKEFISDHKKKRNFIYSYNELTTSSSEIKGWSSIYIPLIVKTKYKKDIFSLTLEAKDNEGKNKEYHVVDYDYMNWFINVSREVATVDEINKFNKSIIFKDNNGKDDYIGVLLIIGNIFGQISPSYKIRGATNHIKDTEEKFSELSTLFLDLNKNGKLDKVDEPLLTAIGSRN